MDQMRRAARSPSPFRRPGPDGEPAYLLTDLAAFGAILCTLVASLAMI